MDTCQYVPVTFEKYNEPKVFTAGPFVKQLFISTCVWAHFFTIGLWFGTPTVVIPQMRREMNSTGAISDEMESWISSAIGYAALPWAVIFPICIRYCGRKLPFIFASITALTSFIVYYSSSTAGQILVAEIIHGVVFSSNATVSILVVTEYTSPRHRGMFLTMKSATLNIGICIANVIGTFFHWKNIPILGMLCSVYSFGAVFWPESPYWLASKGRFDECVASHRWLKGTSDESEKELKNLIESQKDYRKRCSERQVPVTWICLKKFVRNVGSKTFYKPTLLSLLMFVLYFLSGKLVCIIYATQIIKKISNSVSAAYTGMLILDGITVLGMYFGCVFSKILNRRTLLLNTSFSGALFLYILSLYLYLVKLSIIKENAVVSLIFLAVFSMSVSCGPLIMSTSIYAELIPLRYKSFSIIVTVLFCGLFHATILKLSPYFFRAWGMHGTFLFFGISLSVCIYLVYKFLPETKDKTLQEIENCFKDDLQEGCELKQLNNLVKK